MDPETLSANKMVLRQRPPLLLIAVIAALGEGGLYLALVLAIAGDGAGLEALIYWIVPAVLMAIVGRAVAASSFQRATARLRASSEELVISYDAVYVDVSYYMDSGRVVRESFAIL
ncbi:MAG: hypothetical protein KZQ99_11975 [Candidatus Thiodiazotropha sp. (ex Dulcina madagascariensis)]|nr:hypothetical protein [Candidatus Thiodiazotropha sp. (ex Dulcina madagascariensis)]